ncbi:MAG: AIPR family protein [Limnobacter sp.]|uniref:AIPR family protein n=1 Tax=Limnobacter sp. TaxID=2003368 RepID=UPI0032EFEC91
MNTFQVEESLPPKIPEPELFEHFVNFCVISNEYGEEFDVDEVHTGGGDDLGIDGLAVIVNGALVDDEQEINDLANLNKYLEVEFIFCQAKSGGNFSGADISSLFFGVKDLFSTKPALPRNTRVAEKEALVRFVYSKSALFKRGNPSIKVYYATTGKWVEDVRLLARIETEKDGLMETDIFKSVDFIPLDARALQRLHSNSKNRFSKSVEFLNKVTLPGLPGVQESYLGYLPFDQFIKLITDDTGNVLRGIFYDNVRDFQGDNPVNIEIGETLKSDEQQLFVLLNNGVTIVADALTRTGDNFTLEDFQIVNGCQTSHVLFNNKEAITKPVQIPVKLIISKDGQIKNRIIKATNRQTQVKSEELTALTDFQKSLEDYYEVITGDCKLYYERRSQQFRASTGIEKIRVVTIPNQIRAFASMFLGLPHQASRYYGTLLKSIETKIFVPDHHPVAYYCSALALFRLESLTRRKALDPMLRPFKYHLLPIARLLLVGEAPYPMNSNRFERYCESLVTALRDEKACLGALEGAAKILSTVLGGNMARDRAKDTSILAAAEALCAEQAKKS